MSKRPGPSNKKEIVPNETRQKQELKMMKKIDMNNLKQEIDCLRDQLKELINQKISIEKQIQKQKQQFMNQSYDLEKITNNQDEELVKLQNSIKILKNTFSEVSTKKKTEFAREVWELETKKQLQRQQLRRQQTQLENKIEHLKNFKQRETQYFKTLSQLQERKQYLEFSHSKDIQRINSNLNDRCQEIKQISNKKIQNIQSSEVAKLREKLIKQQQIKRENELIQQEIQLCQEEKAIVENQCKLLGQEVKRNTEPDSQIFLGNQATETYERSLRVIKLEGKINKLKQFLNEEIKRLEDQMKMLDKTFDENEKLTNEKIEKLKSSLSLKERDFKKVKACCQMVLNQRSNLQAYLLQVFYENASLNSKDPSNVNQILRKLFSKINSKKQPASYKDFIDLESARSTSNYSQEFPNNTAK